VRNRATDTRKTLGIKYRISIPKWWLWLASLILRSLDPCPNGVGFGVQLIAWWGVEPLSGIEPLTY
jgi:hypothetical protein